MIGIIPRLKSLLGWGAQREEYSPEEHDHEDVNLDAAADKLEELLSPKPPIQQAMDAHLEEVEEWFGEVDGAFVHVEEDAWQVISEIEFFETETGTDGRVTVPAEIREECDIGHGDTVVVELEVFDSRGDRDDIYTVGFEADIRTDGRVGAPEDIQDGMDWEPGIHTRVSLYEVIEESSLDEWEEEITLPGEEEEEDPETDPDPLGFNANIPQ